MTTIPLSVTQSALDFPSATAADWNASLPSTATSNEVTLLVDAAIETSPHAELIRSVGQFPAGPAVIGFQPEDSMFRVDLPANVDAFLPLVPSLAAVAFRTDTPLPPFPDVDEPLRGWLMALVEAGIVQQRISVLPPSPGEFSAEVLPRLRPANPGRRREWLRDRIERIEIGRLLGRGGSSIDATPLRAGLLHLNDFLDASHEHAQRIEGDGRHRNGDYWHAIMHRREPDYSNAKYWFRRVDSHPIFPDLAARAQTLLAMHPELSQQWGSRLCPGGRWNPMAFVDLCQSCPQAESDDASLFARRLQWIEMLLLLEQTGRDTLE